MVVDEVVALADPTTGIPFADRTVDAIAYVDNLIIFSESTATLQQKLACSDAALQLAGVRINMGFKDSGLGVPSFAASIPIQKTRHMEKPPSSSCPVLHCDGLPARVCEDHQQFTIPGTIMGNPVGSKREAVVAWRSVLAANLYCRYLRCMEVTRESIHPTGCFLVATSEDYNFVPAPWELRFGDVVGIQGVWTLTAVAYVGHPNPCTILTHLARCARQNRVARLLAKSIRRGGYEVLEKTRIPTAGTFCKPDLIVKNGVAAVVIDVAVSTEEQLLESWDSKRLKYSQPSTQRPVMDCSKNIGWDVREMRHEPTVFGYHGLV
ncbi:uncharacterized protein [Mobula birostris]|uniref:uncharacterized protein n=1 Tax=Mobula birostris TaxID=1983395 RepID=UPI003B28C5F7